MKTNDEIRVLNVPFSNCSFYDIFVKMDERIQKNQLNNYISITNTESLYHATRMPEHFHYINNAEFSCCDGVGIVLGGRIFGLKIPRLHGPDLLYECCKFGMDKKWKHFFYGGKNGVSRLLSDNLTRKFPRLITCGTYSPPFRELTNEEDRAVVEIINKANPDILWVGLGLLKQERWIAEHLSKIRVSWMIGVGAAFDFFAGTVKRAPGLFRHFGLEWLYRLSFEPRMLKRNLYSFTILIHLIKKAIFDRYGL